MNPIVRNILAVIAGIILGMIVNISLVELGYLLIPLEGYNTDTLVGFKEAVIDFTPKNFIFPFLAHALGTLVGALVAALIATTHKIKFALGIGVFFLLGGITMIMQLCTSLYSYGMDRWKNRNPKKIIIGS